MISNPIKDEEEKVYDINLKIRNECLEHTKANFALNIELFAVEGYASLDRIDTQINYANKLGNVICSFSVSHYFMDKELYKSNN